VATRSAEFSGAGKPGNGGTSISARGVADQDVVTKFYDGNRNFTLAGTLTFPFDTWAVEQIEVLKGPASVLYGLAGIAGAYNVIPKYSSEDFHLISSCPCWAYTSCLNGQKKVGFCSFLAILANYFSPLSKALRLQKRKL
jgi:outer membrane cobalamin receptor